MASTSSQPASTESPTEESQICPVYSRPGRGTAGNIVPVYVNWYRLNCELNGKVIYSYEIHIEQLSRKGKQKELQRATVKGRDLIRLLFWHCIRCNADIFGPHTQTVFDDFKIVFSMNRWRLKNDEGEVFFSFKEDRGPEKHFSMLIYPLKRFEFNLNSVMEDERNISALLTKALFTQRARYAPEADDRSWSFVNRWDVCYGSLYFVPRSDCDPKVIVGPGVRAWLGAYASVKVLEDFKPALAFGLVNRLYYEVEMDLITFYCEVLEEMGFCHHGDRSMNQVLKGMGMNKQQRDRLTDRLSGVRLMTRKFLVRDRDGRFYFTERRMFFVAAANFSPRTFICDKRTMTTMEEVYYRLGSRLEFPGLPLCEVKIGATKHLIPMEVLFIHEKPQRYTKTMSNFMKMKFIKGVCRGPTAHKQLTDAMFNMMEFDNPQMNFISDFMFSVIPNMITCNGLVLDPPNLIDKERNSLPLTEKRAISQVILNEPVAGEIYCAVVIMARDERNGNGTGLKNVCEKDDVGTFFYTLMDSCRERGLNIAENPLIRVYDKIPRDKFEHCVEDANQRFLEKQIRSASAKILLILVVNDRNQNFDGRLTTYGLIKSICDNKYGIASQVVDVSTLENAVKKPSKTIYYNIALKINGKLGGVNQAVVFDNESGTAEVSPKDAVMYVGIDVTHPTANSGIDISIAAMVSNYDLAATRYKNEIFAQMEAKETVELFEYQFRRLMMKFQEHTGVWPRHIVILRDGVSDSEMLRTAFMELKCIRDSWTQLTHADTDLDVTYTYIVIQKRHVTRFYQSSGKDEKGNAIYVNVTSGTVIDNTVVSPRLFDFYLASQFGAIGTTRPAHYTVVVDEWMLSADQIYEMCYKLCFLYARCRIPVSLPCPVYYAHLVCEKAKEVYKTLNSKHEFDGIDVEMRKNEIEKRLVVHEAYPGMHFV